MSEVTNEEVKKAVHEVKAGFEEFKRVNDQRLKAIEEGKGTAELQQKLDRINADLDKNEKLHAEWLKKQEEHSKRVADLDRKLEALSGRSELGLGGARTERAELERKAFDKLIREGAEALSADEVKVLTRSNDKTGGYLAPAEFVKEIIKGVVDLSPIRELVRVRQIGTAKAQIPKRTGTAAASRIGEIQTRGETQNPEWGLLELDAPEMFAEARVSQQNLEDSAFDLEAELREDFVEQFGVKEGQEVITGNGVNQCLGILDANAAGPGVPLASVNSGSAATIGADADALIDLQHAVKTQYAKNGKWALNRNTLGSVRKLKDGEGRYIWQPGVGNMPSTILNAPYVECPDMPDQAADAKPIAFGDWFRGYTLTERIQIVLVRDHLTLAGVGQVKFHARRRVGGQVVMGEAIKLLKCAA